MSDMPDFLRRDIKRPTDLFPSAHSLGGDLALQSCSVELAATVYIHLP